eukprot:12893420-Prorocentrum_lima.AAC.1
MKAAPRYQPLVGSCWGPHATDTHQECHQGTSTHTTTYDIYPQPQLHTRLQYDALVATRPQRSTTRTP